MSFPRYESYKDSGVEWLGEVPTHWDIAPVKNLANIVNGYPFDSKLFSPTDGFPLIRIRDLNSSSADTYYRGDFVESASITSDDVLIGMDGDFNVGRWLGIGRALLNQRMCCVRGKSRILTRLIEYALPVPLKSINDVTYSTTVKHLSSSQVEKTFIAVPQDEKEQSNIVDFLDRETAKIDALIAEQQRLIELLKEKRQAVISHAVTKGLTNLPGANLNAALSGGPQGERMESASSPEAPMKDSGIEWLGEVPAHWEVIAAKRVASVFVPQRNKPDLNDEGDGIYWATMEDMKSTEIYQTSLWVSAEAARNAGSRVLKQGAVIASCVGNFGVASINAVDLIINQQLQAYIPKTAIKAEFFRYFLGIAKVYFEQVGTAATLTYVNQQGFENLPLSLPPLTEQENIVSYLDYETAKFEVLTAEAHRAIDLFQERRTALISAAVTGKIDVRGLISATLPEEAAA